MCIMGNVIENKQQFFAGLYAFCSYRVDKAVLVSWL